jgi:vancomycin resistance protein YoaR
MLKGKSLKMNKPIKWLLLSVTAFLILLTILIIIGTGLHYFYKNKILIGIYIADQQVGSKTIDEANALVQIAIDGYKQNGLRYHYDSHDITLQTDITSAELDNVYSLVNFLPRETIDKLWLIGHEQGYLNNFWQQIRHLASPKQYNIEIEVDKERLEQALKENFSEFEVPIESAKPIITNVNTIEISLHNLGLHFIYDDIVNKTTQNASQLNPSIIYLQREILFPEIMKSEIGNDEIDNLKEFLQQNKYLTLSYENRNWSIDKVTYQNWIVFKKTSQRIELAFANDNFMEYLTTTIVAQINQDPLDAKFEIIDGRVIEFQNSRDGRLLNQESTLELINNKFFREDITTFDLIVAEQKAKVRVSDTNDLGIIEIIGEGRSDFSGSPSNRIHNIETGAAAVNGLIVKPGETFSLITALGAIDGEHGYLQELVIKGDKTIPEYGGGLCQIGTTTFRAAYGSGLPIVERRNHSYRVSYYEPAGTDATIYSPKPDMRWLNDTGNNILIQTRIEGVELIFEYWGTRDGRVASTTEPRIYNITKPGETKYIETTELAVGEKNCTERAHNGADAEFTYTVTYSDGTINEETFSSHYVAWPEVCLIGVEPEEESEDEIIEE